MNFQLMSLPLLFLLWNAIGDSVKEPKTSQRVGDLVIILIGTEQNNQQTGKDHHRVSVHLRAESTAKQALCVSFSATLKATFGLEYHGYPSTGNPFRIHELLPGEKVEGYYDFFVKDGAEPLAVILRPMSGSQTCVHGNDSLSSIWHSSDEVRFDLTALPPSSTEAQTSPEEPPASKPEPAENLKPKPLDTIKLRIFLTGAKASTPKENALKAFHDHCPQAQLTVVKEKADYVVELAPAGFKQSKNQVAVTTQTGDVIYTGATFNLSNAVKNACAATLQDFTRTSH